MKWLECNIETTSSDDGLPAEILGGMLMELGVTGIETMDPYETKLFLEHNKSHWDYADEIIMAAAPGKAYIRFYLDGSLKCEQDKLKHIHDGLDALRTGEFGPLLGSLALTSAEVDDEDWADKWKQYYKPFRIGQRLVIRPLWEEYDPGPGDVVVALDPGQAFGTGLHESTKLCLEAASDMFSPETKAVLDIGCGSGILTLAALGFAENAVAVAIDADGTAVKVAAANVKLNRQENRVTVLTGNILDDSELLAKAKGLGPYDIVFVNIVADVVIAMTPIVKGLLAPNGAFIASGIIKERLDDVKETVVNQGFRIRGIAKDGEWAAVVSGL